MERRDLFLRALQACNRVLLRYGDLQSLPARLCRILVQDRLFEAVRFDLLESRDPQTFITETCTASGPNGVDVDPAGPAAASMVLEAITAGAFQEFSIKGDGDTNREGSWLVFPLRAEKAVLGAVSVLTGSRQDLDREWVVDLMSDLADTIAFKIAALHARDQGPAPNPGLSGKRVLLVEDEALVRRLVRMELEDVGLDVTEAGSAESALSAVASADRPPDVLVFDISLPGKNGHELYKALSRRFGEIPVVFLTAYADSAFLRREILQRDLPIVEKPFSPDALVNEIENALHVEKAG